MTAPYVGHSLTGLTMSSVVFYRQGVGVFTKEGTSLTTTGSPVATDYVRTPMQPARTSGGTGVSRMYSGNWTANAVLVGWRNTSGTLIMRIIADTTTSCKLQRWDGGAWQDVGSAVTPSTSIGSAVFRFLITFTGLGTSSGSITFVVENNGVIDGTRQITATNLTAMGDIGQIEVYANTSGSSSNIRIGGLFIKDGAADAAYVYAEIPTLNGTDATDGTGGEPEIDDTLSGFDTDFVSLPASGNKRSFKATARDFGGRYVKCVTIELRMRCGVTGPTQAKCYLLKGGTRYYHPTTVTLTTGFLPYTFSWDTDPSTGAAWTAAAAADGNLEFGYEVV